MAMVGVDSGSMYRQTHSLSRLAWSCPTQSQAVDLQAERSEPRVHRDHSNKVTQLR